MVLPELYYGRVATSPLNIIIVGGGTGGLAAAYALEKAGHHTLVIDRNLSSYSEKGGRQNIPPNAVKIFDDWGLGKEIRKGAFRMEGADLRHHDTEILVGRTPFHEDLIRDSGAPYLGVTHDHLFRVLRDVVKTTRAKIISNSTVVDVSPATNTVKLASGRTLKADLIIGADGAYSTVRTCVWPDPNKGETRKWCCSSMVVDGKLMSKDPDLKPLLKTRFTTLWMGPGRCAWGVPILDGTRFALELHYTNPNKLTRSIDKEDDGPLKESSHHWTERPMTPALKTLFADFGTRFTKIMSLADNVYSCTRLDIAPLESFNYPWETDDDFDYPFNPVNTKCNVALLGDAAHPMVPNGVNTTGMALEDAYTLGSLLSRYNPSRPAQCLRPLLSAYTSVRHDRALHNTITEQHKVLFTTLVPGTPEAIQRDEAFRKSTLEQRFDGDEVKATISSLWSFNAREEAEEWWHFWRLPAERSHAASVSKSETPAVKGVGVNVNIRVENVSNRA